MKIDLGKRGHFNFSWREACLFAAMVAGWGRMEIGFAIDRAECAKLKDKIDSVKRDSGIQVSANSSNTVTQISPEE